MRNERLTTRAKLKYISDDLRAYITVAIVVLCLRSGMVAGFACYPGMTPQEIAEVRPGCWTCRLRARQLPADIQPAGRLMLCARLLTASQRKLQQPGPDLRDLLRGHTGITPQNPATIPDLTKYYYGRP